MKFDKKPMVNWYDPKQLGSTGMKTVVSSVFGNFADRREMQAALDPDMGYLDYSEREDIWIDFISDLGDGFNPTYTMAHLLAKEHLEIKGKKIKRGKLLIMGGDEVYPTPEMHEYRNRLQGPYHAAFPGNRNDPDPPHLFAIPGNHDWYDGLTNFIKVFLQKRSLGNWRTQQSRSYFALKLPHNYWLLGIDIQLNADIDIPQLNYFKKIAKEDIKANDKIILVTAEPSWVYKSFSQKSTSHDRFKFFIDKIIFGKTHAEDPDCFYGGKNESIHVTTILTGDLHHYSHYVEEGIINKKCHLITAGGGGAFMHTTHTLKKEINASEGYNATLVETTFPSKSDSKMLGFKNLLFPFYNVSMLLFFGIFHLFNAWLLQVGTKSDSATFMENAMEISFFDAGFMEYITLIGSSLSHIPSVLALNLLLFGGLLVFTDVKSGKGNWNYIAGAIHGLLHVANFYFLIWVFSRYNLYTRGMEIDSLQQVFWFSGEMIVIGGILSGVLFGLYLLVSGNFLNNHITEASSSFLGEDYKNFLRLHLDNKSLTIYPIGVKKVVKNWKDINKGTGKDPVYEGDEVKYDLIEENPITIAH
jgi:hypothetical protein